MKNKNIVLVNARIPFTLKTAIKEYVERGAHINFSDFMRDAMREKLNKDAPWILQEVLNSERTQDAGDS